MASGWDVPPPVASPIGGVWRPRQIKWNTPQRIATLAAEESTTCQPILIQHRYLVVAGAGFVSVFSIDVSLDSSLSLSSESSSSFWKPTAPVLHLSLESNAVIVQLLVVDDYPVSYDNNSSKQSMLALSEEGNIYKLSFSIVEMTPSLVCEESWNTGSFGSSCCAILPRDNDTSLFHLLVGYDSGHLEGWEISRSDAETHNPWDFSLQWRGLMQAPIRSMTPFGRPPLRDDTDDTEGACSLVVTSEATDTGSEIHGTASMVDVLGMDFKVLRTKFISNNRRNVPLHPYLQLPTSGMELVDSSTATTATATTKDLENLPKKVQVLPSRGTDAAISFHDGKQCGVALSDGSVAILSSQTEVDNASASWGITKDVHQLLFSYPVVGCGRIHKGSNVFLACCLRAGTCYLIPLSDEETNEIVAIPYPHDVDVDCTSVYIQGFTAGELEVASNETEGEESSSLSILVYALAGGLDVYACGLIYPQIKDVRKEKEAEEQREFLKTLRDSDILSDILSDVTQIMKQMDNDDSDKLWQNSAWKRAHAEVKAASSSSESITVEQICSPAFASLKSLLLSLFS
jgi:hypothetical protein